MLLSSAELTIDHVTVAGKSLKRMQAALAAAGIPSENGGPHNNHATEMALTSFPDGSYLELIALQSGADPQAVAAHPWSKLLQGDAGPSAWVVRAKDIPAEIQRLKAAGVAVNPPVRSGRVRPDGVKLDWETAQIGKEPNGTFFPFLIRDYTDRKERAWPSRKPTTKDFSGVTRVVIAVNDLDAAVKRYQEAYGLSRPIKQADKVFGARIAGLGGTPVILAAPLNAQSWLITRLEQFGEGPCAFVLGAKRANRYKAAFQTRWFGADISWFDPDQLGWRLGFE